MGVFEVDLRTGSKDPEDSMRDEITFNLLAILLCLNQSYKLEKATRGSGNTQLPVKAQPKRNHTVELMQGLFIAKEQVSLNGQMASTRYDDGIFGV